MTTPTAPDPGDRPSAAAREAARVAREKVIHQQQRAESRRRHARAGGRDMVLSMAVLLVPIVALVWFFQTSPDKPNVPVAQVSPAAAQARASAGFAPLVPAGLDGWKPVRASFAAAGQDLTGFGTVRASTWVLGYQSPAEVYYELDQQSGSNASFLQDVTHRGAAGGTRTVGNDAWTEYTGDDDRTHSLVRLDGSGSGQSTVVVRSTASFDDLATFAAALSASR